MPSTSRRVAAIAIASMLALTSFAAEAATKSRHAARTSAAVRALQNSGVTAPAYGNQTPGSNFYNGGIVPGYKNTAGWQVTGMT
jgi:hypothetical protein